MRVIGYLLVAVLGVAMGVFSQRQGWLPGPPKAMVESGESSAQASGERKPLYWVAPMDKNYRRDKPGKSPMGMDLVPVYEEDVTPEEGGVKISPTVVNNLGVRTGLVERGDITLPVETVGYVRFDEDKLHHIHSRVDGWIEVLNVKSTGDPVRKGQTLYELYSPSLVNAQEEYLAALRSNNAILRNASVTRLYSLGLLKEQILALEKRRTVEQRISVTAKSDGVVKDLNVREGMFIKPATEVMSVGTLDTVWVIAEVFERLAGQVRTGQKVSLRSDAYPDAVWEGQVDYLYPVLDSKTRTLNVRVRVPNQDGRLRPNMYVHLSIETDVAKSALSIPREALIKSGSHTRVVKVLGSGEYKSVLVRPGIEFDHRVQILDGLSEGDRVVTSAQFLIDSESNIDAELARLESAPAQQETDSNTVVATGTIQGVMKDMKMVTIHHDPIPAWEWPSMKMDFLVNDNVNLDHISVGEKVSFTLEKTGEWDYLVTKLSGTSEKGDSSASTAMPEGKQVQAKGKVKSLMLDMGMIEVVHDPITEWGWPTMSMSFTVPNPEAVPSLRAGDQIRFKLTETEDGEYLITDIEKN